MTTCSPCTPPARRLSPLMRSFLWLLAVITTAASTTTGTTSSTTGNRSSNTTTATTLSSGPTPADNQAAPTSSPTSAPSSSSSPTASPSGSHTVAPSPSGKEFPEFGMKVVVVNMTVNNVDFWALVQNTTIGAAFENRTRKAVADFLGAAITADMVMLNIFPGSLALMAFIMPSKSMSNIMMKSILQDQRSGLATAVAEEIRLVPHIDLVATGDITVVGVKVFDASELHPEGHYNESDGLGPSPTNTTTWTFTSSGTITTSSTSVIASPGTVDPILTSSTSKFSLGTTVAITTTATTTSTITSSTTSSTSSVSTRTTATTTTSATTTTTVTFASKEEEIEALKEKAEEVVENLDAQEEAAVTEVLADILANGTNLEDLESPLVLESEEATIAVVPTTGLDEATKSVDIPVPVDETGFAANVEVPVATLRAIIDSLSVASPSGTTKAVVVSVRPASDEVRAVMDSLLQETQQASSGVDAETGEATDESRPRLASKPLSVSLFAEDGTALQGVQLQEPIVLTLLPSGAEDLSCAYWDTKEKKWSSRGVKRIFNGSIPAGQLQPVVCETTHLSIFAAVKGVLEKAMISMRCSNIGTLLNSRAIRRVWEDTDWIDDNAADVLWVILSCGWVGFCGAILWDIVEAKREHLLTEPGQAIDAPGGCSNSIAEASHATAASSSSKATNLSPMDTNLVRVQSSTSATLSDQKPMTAAQRYRLVASRMKQANALKRQEAEEACKTAAKEGQKDGAGCCNHCCAFAQYLVDTCCQTLVKQILKPLRLPTAVNTAILHLPQLPDEFLKICVQRVHAHQVGVHANSIDSLIEHEIKELRDSDRAADRAAVKAGLLGALQQEAGGAAVDLAAAVRESLSGAKAGPDEKPPAKAPLAVQSGAVNAADGSHETLRDAYAACARRFMESTWVYKVFLMMLAVHPWMLIMEFSAYVSHSARLALLVAEVLASTAMGALFYQAGGGALSRDSDPSCKPPEEFWTRIVNAATVAIACCVMSGIPIAFIALLLSIDPDLDRKEMPPIEYVNRSLLMRTRRFLFCCLVMTYIAACILIDVTFLANVSKEDAMKWRTSSAFILLQDFVLIPMALGFSLATVAMVCVYHRRRADEDKHGDDEVSDVAVVKKHKNRRLDAATHRRSIKEMDDVGEIKSVAVSADGSLIATGGSDGMLRLLSVETLAVRNEFAHGGGKEVTSVAFSGDGAQLITGCRDRKLRVFEAAELTLRQELEFDGEVLVAVASGPGGNRIITGSGDARLRLIDIETMETLKELKFCDDGAVAVSCLSYSPDASSIVTATSDGRLLLVDAETLEVRKEFKGHAGGAARSLAFSPDGKLLVTAPLDCVLRVFDATTLEVRQEVKDWSGCRANTVAFTHDGSSIVAAFGDWIRWLDPENLTTLQELFCGSHCATFAFTPSSSGDMPPGMVLARGQKIAKIPSIEGLQYYAPHLDALLLDDLGVFLQGFLHTDAGRLVAFVGALLTPTHALHEDACTMFERKLLDGTSLEPPLQAGAEDTLFHIFLRNWSTCESHMTALLSFLQVSQPSILLSALCSLNAAGQTVLDVAIATQNKPAAELVVKALSACSSAGADSHTAARCAASLAIYLRWGYEIDLDAFLMRPVVPESVIPKRVKLLEGRRFNVALCEADCVGKEALETLADHGDVQAEFRVLPLKGFVKELLVVAAKPEGWRPEYDRMLHHSTALEGVVEVNWHSYAKLRSQQQMVSYSLYILAFAAWSFSWDRSVEDGALPTLTLATMQTSDFWWSISQAPAYVACVSLAALVVETVLEAIFQDGFNRRVPRPCGEVLATGCSLVVVLGCCLDSFDYIRKWWAGILLIIVTVRYIIEEAIHMVTYALADDTWIKDSPWHWIDIVTFLTTGTSVGLSLRMQAESDAKAAAVSLTAATMVLQWLRLSAYLRCTHTVGPLITSVWSISKRVAPFLCLFTLWLVGPVLGWTLLATQYPAANSLRLEDAVACEASGAADGFTCAPQARTFYSTAARFWSSVLVMYRLAFLGDFYGDAFALADYSGGDPSDGAGGASLLHTSVISWCMFLYVSLFFFVALLNMLIAIMCEAYSEGLNRKHERLLRSKANVCIAVRRELEASIVLNVSMVVEGFLVFWSTITAKLGCKLAIMRAFQVWRSMIGRCAFQFGDDDYLAMCFATSEAQAPEKHRRGLRPDASEWTGVIGVQKTTRAEVAALREDLAQEMSERLRKAMEALDRKVELKHASLDERQRQLDETLEAVHETLEDIASRLQDGASAKCTRPGKALPRSLPQPAAKAAAPAGRRAPRRGAAEPSSGPGPGASSTSQLKRMSE
eukprot:TRINITY_DN4182_c0_g1_i2.p1 TRINITY_DN4182_c0_g1~~TRINITY_DN4182_c0_g1_i2.p1  ORF type:complete len:2314 (-),score=424.53 TRINITY_DN4182_c0_g1_i2:378-7319(-)